MRAMRLFLQVLMSMVLAASADAGLNLQTLLVESPEVNRRFCATVGDVDSDGRNEVVVASTTDQTVRVLRFGLTGTWTEVDSVPVPVPTFWQVTSLSVLDMDGDGDRDIALWLRANGQRGRLVVISTEPGGRSVSSWDTPETDSCYAAAIADVNGDGLPDVVTCRHGWFTSESTAFVTWNANGPGRFSSHLALPIPWSPSVKTYVGDFDHDGNADLAVAAHPWGPVGGTFFFQRMPGTFEASAFAPGDGTKAVNLAFADLDGDGDLEMVSDSSVPYVDSNRVHVYGLGASLFPHSVTLFAGPGVYQPVVADFDGDGLTDIAVDDRATGTLRFFGGLVGGGVSSVGEVVATPELLAVVHDPAGIGDQLAAGDVDNDGDLDLLLATDGLVWIRQLAGPPVNPVAAFEYSPAVASPGVPVRFVDASIGSPVAWRWDFGDGQTSAERNPAHAYGSAGVFAVTLTVTNETATASATKQVLVNAPPVADAGPDRIVDAADDCRALVTLDGSLSNDPDGDALSYSWAGPFGIASGPRPEVELGLGSHQITLTVSDGKGGEATDGVVVVVQDVSAPQMTQPVASPPVLWPPNGKLVPVQIALAAADSCGAAACRITAVSSNEPATGDWLVTGDLTLDLRAKRLGTGSGRVYDVTVTCTDGAGNASSRSVKVTVPHNQ